MAQKTYNFFSLVKMPRSDFDTIFSISDAGSLLVIVQLLSECGEPVSWLCSIKRSEKIKPRTAIYLYLCIWSFSCILLSY